MDFGEDLAAGISQLQMKATEYRIAQKAYAEARKKRELFEQEHNMKELAAVEKCPYSLDELNSMIRDVDERSEDIREAIEQYHHQLEDLQDQLDIRAFIRNPASDGRIPTECKGAVFCEIFGSDRERVWKVLHASNRG